jgi:hypothetical protein
METQELIDALKHQREAIGSEAIHQLDFDKLDEDLADAASALGKLDQTEKLCQGLLLDFKGEIKRMALAISRAKGETGSCGLVEKLISSADISLDDLLFLREKVREEFNRCFPLPPQSKVTGRKSEPRKKVAEFKTGTEINRS